MNTRMSLQEVLPKGYKAMMDISKYAFSTILSLTHQHLIQIRVSQINGCAFCLDMHTKAARKAGETEQRIYTLNAWRETSFFTPEEQAILMLAEEVTLIGNHVPDEIYSQAVRLLGEEYVAAAIISIVVINGWNRIAITTRMMPALN